MINKNVRQKIFVCDDEVKVRSHIESMLSHTYDVSGASSGQELLDALSKNSSFDLILLDNNMPGMKGIEVLIEVKKRYPAIKVVMFSGDKDIKKDCLLAGGSAFIPKPASIHEILETIKNVLTGESIKDENKITTLSLQYDEINNGLHTIGLIAHNAIDEIANISPNEHLKNYKKINEQITRAAEAVTVVEAFLHVNNINFQSGINLTELNEYIKKHSDYNGMNH